MALSYAPEDTGEFDKVPTTGQMANLDSAARTRAAHLEAIAEAESLPHNPEHSKEIFAIREGEVPFRIKRTVKEERETA